MGTPRRGIVLAMVFLLGCSLSHATEVRVPYGIYVEQFKKESKEKGFDLNDVDGFIQNKGNNFVIYTYKPITDEQLELIKDLTWNNMRR